MPKTKAHELKKRPAGEPFVWFTGMGLALGLAMIVFLLGLIVVKGLDVFWPKRVVLLTLHPESAAGIGKSGKLAGIVTKEQERINRVLASDQTGTGGERIKEWQLFVGNKDIYGAGFIFLDYRDIEKIEYPDDIMRIERMEYGEAFGYPVALKLAGGETFSAGEIGFLSRLKLLAEEANVRWGEIREIEKKEIGKINRRLEKLRLREKMLLSQGRGKRSEELRRIREETERLKAWYSVHAGHANTLRRMQTQEKLVYRLATGEEKELPLGQIVHFYFPNQPDVFDRMRLFFRNIWVFLSHDPREANTEGGVFPAIFGTFVMTVLMSAAVMPFGVLAAIYLREYAKQGLLVRSVRIAVNNLAGVPSIVFGVFGLGFFVYFVGGTIDSLFFKEALPTPTFGTGGILWASLTLALLTVPVVIVATEEALAAVPRGMREGSLACGASKWQTIQRIVLPAAAPGIMTGLVLAMARGAGEVAPLMIVGVVKLAPSLPIDNIFPYIHLERKFMHLGFHIYDLGFQSPDSEAAKPMVFATTLLLIVLVVLLNLGAIFVRERLRKKYATGAF